jgi:hypothetical protein
VQSLDALPKWRESWDYYADAKLQHKALVNFLGFVDTLADWEVNTFAGTGRLSVTLSGISENLWDTALRSRCEEFVLAFPSYNILRSGEMVMISAFSMRLARILQERMP